MSTTLNDLEKVVNSGLTTAVKKSEINFNQLFIDVDIENVISTILFLKTNKKIKFRQLIDITAVDYPHKEKRCFLQKNGLRKRLITVLIKWASKGHSLVMALAGRMRVLGHFGVLRVLFRKVAC